MVEETVYCNLRSEYQNELAGQSDNQSLFLKMIEVQFPNFKKMEIGLLLCILQNSAKN